MLRILSGVLTLLLSIPVLSAECQSDRVVMQVLGSGGPELDDGRASSSYLVWLDGKAKAIVDMGPGSSVNFGEAGGRLEDINVMLLSHLHVDHSADLPAYIKGSFFSGRDRDLTLLGPDGNDLMPSMSQFLSRLFGSEGAFAYLSNYWEPDQNSAFKLKAKSVGLDLKEVTYYPIGSEMIVSAIPVHHGPIAAVAWRVDMAGCAITFSGDMNNDYQTLKTLAVGSDMLVIHNAVPEIASSVARNLHMTPSQIGQIASEAGVEQLIISHRMKRTLGSERNTLQQIEKTYSGPVHFAEDLDRFNP